MKTFDQLVDEQKWRTRVRSGRVAVLLSLPPKRKSKPLTPRQREQIKAARVRQRQRWLVQEIVKPKNDAERAWLAERQRAAA